MARPILLSSASSAVLFTLHSARVKRCGRTYTSHLNHASTRIHRYIGKCIYISRQENSWHYANEYYLCDALCLRHRACLQVETSSHAGPGKGTRCLLLTRLDPRRPSTHAWLPGDPARESPLLKAKVRDTETGTKESGPRA